MKKENSYKHPARSCFFLSQILAKFVTNISNIVTNKAK